MRIARVVAAGVLLLGAALAVCPSGVAAQERPLRGQLLYAPAYSQIHYGDRERVIDLAATLSVRNVDRAGSLIVRRVEYVNASGVRVRAFLTAPRTLAPLASAVFVVAESDEEGGVNPSFLVEWASDAPIAPPGVETVMVGTRSGQGISFVLPARVLEERP